MFTIAIGSGVDQGGKSYIYNEAIIGDTVKVLDEAKIVHILVPSSGDSNNYLSIIISLPSIELKEEMLLEAATVRLEHKKGTYTTSGYIFGYYEIIDVWRLGQMYG